MAGFCLRLRGIGFQLARVRRARISISHSEQPLIDNEKIASSNLALSNKINEHIFLIGYHGEII